MFLLIFSLSEKFHLPWLKKIQIPINHLKKILRSKVLRMKSKVKMKMKKRPEMTLKIQMFFVGAYMP
jgi:hypothetical protein